MDEFTVFLFKKEENAGCNLDMKYKEVPFMIGLFYGTIICEFVESRGALWK